MSLQPLIPLVVLPLILSAAGMTYGAAYGSRTTAVIAAMAFALVVILVAGRINRPCWREPEGGHPPQQLFHTMRRNTRLAALVYAWGALSFFAIYGLSDVTWRHGFQYGTAAALISAGLLFYVHRMGSPGHDVPPTRTLTLLHALAVLGGLAFLVMSGKLASLRGDWPANYIFLFGGLALVGLCIIAYRTQRILEGPNRPG
jgi:hypothetical protein